MKIIVDAMGGDNAPAEIVRGCIEGVKKLDIELVLVGKQELIEAELKKNNYSGSAITIVNADEVISGDDDPITAVRHKKKSSMHIGLTLAAKGEGDAFVSAGNTRAYLGRNAYSKAHPRNPPRGACPCSAKQRGLLPAD